MSQDSLLPNEVVRIIKEHGFQRFNTTWLGYWEAENTVDRNNPENGHYGKGGRYFWHRSILASVLKYCNDNNQRLR